MIAGCATQTMLPSSACKNNSLSRRPPCTLTWNHYVHHSKQIINLLSQKSLTFTNYRCHGSYLIRTYVQLFALQVVPRRWQAGANRDASWKKQIITMLNLRNARKEFTDCRISQYSKFTPRRRIHPPCPLIPQSIAGCIAPSTCSCKQGQLGRQQRADEIRRGALASKYFYVRRSRLPQAVHG
jgi:hypothetical protein